MPESDERQKPYVIALLPGMFYMMVISSFILNAKIGFNLPWPISYVIAAVLTVAYTIFVVRCGKNKRG